MIKLIKELTAPVIIVIGVGSLFTGLCALQSAADAKYTRDRFADVCPAGEVAKDGDCAPACPESVIKQFTCMTDTECEIEADKLGRANHCFFDEGA